MLCSVSTNSSWWKLLFLTSKNSVEPMSRSLWSIFSFLLANPKVLSFFVAPFSGPLKSTFFRINLFERKERFSSTRANNYWDFGQHFSSQHFLLPSLQNFLPEERKNFINHSEQLLRFWTTLFLATPSLQNFLPEERKNVFNQSEQLLRF